MTSSPLVPTRPNILLVVTDQERRRSWLPPGLTLPNRERLIREGVEVTGHHTHASPCSPARASLFTGQYLNQHGITENVIFPAHRELSPTMPTIGHILRDAGYTTAYLGKWHLSQAAKPDMTAYGFGDWSGDDRAFMGRPGAGQRFDYEIARQAASWIAAHAADTRPWFLTVSLINPHDAMWFPLDQADWQREHPGIMARLREEVIPFPEEVDEVFDQLPESFDDDLHTKPPVQRQWWYEDGHHNLTYLHHDDKRSWLRMLDYYWRLHQESDSHLGIVLDALDHAGRSGDTAVVFTSDHGEMSGAHGMRNKGPFVYREIMNVPLYARVPGLTTPGTRSDALCTHVDLTATLAALGGVQAGNLRGRNLLPVLADPTMTVRDTVLFAQDQGWYRRCVGLRYAIRAIFDGRFKYARYYGVGGSIDEYGEPDPGSKLFDEHVPFEDHDHELYDLQEDPFELVNLANDRSRRHEVREWFHRLKEEETLELAS